MFYKRLELNLIELADVGSTNNYAANLLKEGNAANGTTILTKRQSSGRGQRGNGWFSEPGKNLIQSTIVFLSLPIDKSFYLNIAVSLAVNRTLLDFGLKSTIKWPNDIYCGNRKIAGILNETQLQGTVIKSGIIGVGLNVNQISFDTLLNATSMLNVTGKEYLVKDVFLKLYSHLDFYLDHLDQQNYGLLLRQYYANMFRYEIEAKYTDSSGSFVGKIKGITDLGHLIVQQAGRTKSYDLKEIKFEI